MMMRKKRNCWTDQEDPNKQYQIIQKEQLNTTQRHYSIESLNTTYYILAWQLWLMSHAQQAWTYWTRRTSPPHARVHTRRSDGGETERALVRVQKYDSICTERVQTTRGAAEQKRGKPGIGCKLPGTWAALTRHRPPPLTSLLCHNYLDLKLIECSTSASIPRAKLRNSHLTYSGSF